MMNLKVKQKSMRMKLVRQQKRLKRNADSNYQRFLLQLCLGREHITFIPHLKALIKSKDWAGVLEFADYLASLKHEAATDHFVANQFALLVRKYPFLPSSVNTDPEGKALSTFLASERKCSRMNRVFELFNKRSPYESYLAKMRSVIRYIIGDAPNISAVNDRAGFGPGASVGLSGSSLHVGKKLTTEWTVTPSAMTYAYNAVVSHDQFRYLLYEKEHGYYCIDDNRTFDKFRSRLAYVTHNNISFVLKTARTYRTIGKEPLLNGYLQKGVDTDWKNNLLRFGINLKSQKRNQEMAREGSLDDSEESFVTIDLKSASDCGSIGLVRNLFPEDWFGFLNSIRSKDYMLYGKLYQYHKFCSMGNGFCFPLETLVFTAACESVGCGKPGIDYSIFGDDIVVRKKHAAKVIWLLSKLGFSVNKEKTFIQGPFRESCGADWYLGENVRPFTLDFKLDSVESIFKILNLTKGSSSTEAFFKSVRPFLFSLLDESFRLVRPFTGNADSGIDGYADEVLLASNCNYRFVNGSSKYSWLELQHVPISDRRPIPPGADDESVVRYALLFGLASSRRHRLGVEFSLRRETKTKMTLISHPGATSLWLPAP